MMNNKIKCPYCNRELADASGVYSHVKKKHPNKKRAHLRPDRPEQDESMADIFIEAELNRAMGIKNDDWIEDMLP